MTTRISSTGILLPNRLIQPVMPIHYQVKPRPELNRFLIAALIPEQKPEQKKTVQQSNLMNTFVANNMTNNIVTRPISNVIANKQVDVYKRMMTPQKSSYLDCSA